MNTNHTNRSPLGSSRTLAVSAWDLQQEGNPVHSPCLRLSEWGKDPILTNRKVSEFSHGLLVKAFPLLWMKQENENASASGTCPSEHRAGPIGGTWRTQAAEPGPRHTAGSPPATAPPPAKDTGPADWERLHPRSPLLAATVPSTKLPVL